MCTAREVYHRTNEDGAKIIMVEKITMMPQRSTRRRPTNFKMLVCQSLDVSTLETVCLTTIKC